MEYRIEKDSLGEIEVPKEKLWAAQTERSRRNFKIGEELMPKEIIHALAIVKKAASITNYKLGLLDKNKQELIETACNEIISGQLDNNFPLSVWQTGSGTQTNMNVNEVIANRANEIAKEEILHPNDHVNMSQSTNDAFPTAIHIAGVIGIEDHLIKAIKKLIATFLKLEKENEGIIKSGRTHLQDATPIAFSQEISGWRGMAEQNLAMIESSLGGLKNIALGGTAVGTGLNAPKNFGELSAKEISDITSKTFVSQKNKFHALSSKDAMVFAHGALKALGANLMKIANDVRWLASGPRLGLGEIFIPENEMGSSIMPGKINPTQCEALTMIAVQVMANDVAIGFSASQGNFQLNVFMPILAYNFLQSVRLLSDGINSFSDNCVQGIKANKEKMEQNLNNSLMLVTALNPYIGYDKSVKVAKFAYSQNLSIKEACVSLGFLTSEKFDEVFNVDKMI
ncbi:MAG TPA: class II fumarate hydratase [Clostridia bacterium]|nr:class II fumarate hydratase [Clostridia bacterium]